MSPHSLPCIEPPLLHFFLTFVYLNIKIVNLQFGSESEYAYSSDFKQIDSIFSEETVFYERYIFLCVSSCRALFFSAILVCQRGLHVMNYQPQILQLKKWEWE